MTIDAALDWLHNHGYSEDVELTRTYLMDGGSIRTMSSTWTVTEDE